MNNKISVVIPFYSGVEWLFEAVQSVIDQTYDNIEIIVINDGSNEDVTAFLDRYKGRIIYKYKENEGPGVARNVGIDLASGDYICFLDSDDLWQPHKTESQLNFMLKNDLIWSHTGGEYFYSNESKRKQFNFLHNVGKVAKRSLISMQIATPSVMIRSDVLKDNYDLRFNAKMRFSQDSFLYMLLAQRYVLGYLDDNCVSIRLRNMKEGHGMINASRRFRIRFAGRRTAYSFIKSEKNSFIPKLPLYINLLFKQYLLGDDLLCFLEQKDWKFINVEFIAKILFIYLFVFGRIYIIFNDYICNLEDN